MLTLPYGTPGPAQWKRKEPAIHKGNAEKDAQVELEASCSQESSQIIKTDRSQPQGRRLVSNIPHYSRHCKMSITISKSLGLAFLLLSFAHLITSSSHGHFSCSFLGIQTLSFDSIILLNWDPTPGCHFNLITSLEIFSLKQINVSWYFKICVWMGRYNSTH